MFGVVPWLAGRATARRNELLQRAEEVKPTIMQVLERYMGSYLTLVLLISAIVWFASANALAMTQDMEDS